MVYILYCLASIIALAIPGPDFLLVFQTSLSKGKLAGFYSAVGIGLGLTLHATAATLGLSALMLKSAQIFEIVKFAGALYLVYLAVLLIRDLFKKEHDEVIEVASDDLVSKKRYLLRGFLTNALNIKAALFFVAIVPQFVQEGHSPTLQLAVFGLIQVINSVLWFGLVAIAVHKVGTFLRKKVVKRWLDGATAAIFLALATKLATTKKHI